MQRATVGRCDITWYRNIEERVCWIYLLNKLCSIGKQKQNTRLITYVENETPTEFLSTNTEYYLRNYVESFLILQQSLRVHLTNQCITVKISLPQFFHKGVFYFPAYFSTIAEVFHINCLFSLSKINSSPPMFFVLESAT